MRKLFRRLILQAFFSRPAQTAGHTPFYGLLVKTISSDISNMDHLVHALANKRR